MFNLLNMDVGQAAIWKWLSIAVATFVSEDLALLAGVAAANKQVVGPMLVISAYMVGVLVGDVGLYAIGYGFSLSPTSKLHRLAEKLLKWLRLHPDSKDKRDLDAIILLSRFIPGTRLPTYLTAGFVRFSLPRFVMILTLPTLILALITLYASKFMSQFVPDSWWLSVAISIVAFSLSIALFRIGIFFFNYRNNLRLGLKMKWFRLLRLGRAEFWPAWVFYFPVSFIFIAMFLKYRMPSAILYSNPCIPNSGLIGESKYEVERLLERAAPHQHLKSTLLGEQIALNDKLEKLRLFMQVHSLFFPIILKPDYGQRGLGVRVVENEDEAKDYLRSARYDVLAQEYCDWPGELGVYYYRLPDQSEGQVFSVTLKQFPSLVGDGHSTLAELVINDERARYVAHVYEKRWQSRWHSVIGKGEEYPLVACGNHAQGASFTNGEHLLTPILLKKIDAIATEIQGFFIGRFDIRYRDEEWLTKEGEFRIIELNGAGGEATDIYDPSYSLLQIYRRLYQQWDLIYKIGKRLAPQTGRVRASVRFLRDLFKFSRRFKRYPESS